jgi:hypothetical protein
MQVNKYLQHILRKSSKAESLSQCAEDLHHRKEEELKTYLFLIQKRLDLPTAHP